MKIKNRKQTCRREISLFKLACYFSKTDYLKPLIPVAGCINLYEDQISLFLIFQLFIFERLGRIYSCCFYNPVAHCSNSNPKCNSQTCQKA